LRHATDVLKDGTLVTVSCAEGDEGKIYDGLLETEVTEELRGELPKLPLKIMLNVGNPQLALISSRCQMMVLVWRVWNSSSTIISVFIQKRFWNIRILTLI
jgi:phosphoenolpyruvate synthase/pyruvate phosphate dikinase